MSKNNNIDVVVTATLRPEILNLTLKSFNNKFLKQFKHKRLIINIDPIGDESKSVQDILNICEKYFDNITYNSPSTPSFPKAVKWCWEQVESEYFLHLEDDWLLKKQINKNILFETLKKNKNIMSIRFYLSRNSKMSTLGNQYCFSNTFSLNPSLVKLSFVQKLLIRFDTALDPEKQFNDIKNSEYQKFLLYGTKNDGYFTIDIGKKWRKLKKFNKPDISLSKNKSWAKENLKSFSLRNYLNYKIHMRYWGYLTK